jgi:hypothetical protein
VHTQHDELGLEGEGEGLSPYYFLGCLLHTIANLACPPSVVDCDSWAW